MDWMERRKELGETMDEKEDPRIVPTFEAHDRVAKALVHTMTRWNNEDDLVAIIGRDHLEARKWGSFSWNLSTILANELPRPYNSVGLKDHIRFGGIMSEENEDVPLDESSDVHDDETPAFEEVEEQMDLSEHVEPVDPLEEAIQRAEKAEKEIAYKDAEIQNVRKRLMAEKSASHSIWRNGACKANDSNSQRC